MPSSRRRRSRSFVLIRIVVIAIWLIIPAYTVVRWLELPLPVPGFATNRIIGYAIPFPTDFIPLQPINIGTGSNNVRSKVYAAAGQTLRVRWNLKVNESYARLRVDGPGSPTTYGTTRWSTRIDAPEQNYVEIVIPEDGWYTVFVFLGVGYSGSYDVGWKVR